MSDDPRRPGAAHRPRTTGRVAAAPSYRRQRAAVALVCGGLAVLAVGGFAQWGGGDAKSAPGPTEPTSTVAAVGITTLPAATAPPTTAPSTSPVPTTTPSIDTPGSLWWVVNPDRPMAADYVPPDLVTPNVPLKPDTGASQLSSATAAAFEAMVADAAEAGHQLQLTSGYRSFDQQQMLYDRFVKDFGAEVAAQRVAVPAPASTRRGWPPTLVS